ncbi:hypothetical protein Tco_1555816 [Tanacetum coccineum]
MAGPVAGNEIARRVVDDLIEFNGETTLNALIAEMEVFDNPGEVFNTLMGLRDDVRVEDAKLMRVNDLIAQAEEEIEMKEAYGFNVLSMFVVIVNYKYEGCKGILLVNPNEKCVLFRLGVVATGFVCFRWDFGKDKLSEVAESPHLVDKMKISLSKKCRLVAELEVVGEVKGVVKCLKHMRVIVARDAVTLGELETLLGRAQVGVSLKAGFVADMEAND